MSTAVPPPDPDWDLSDRPLSSSGSGSTAAPHPQRRFRQTVLLTIAGTVVPGVGLIAARRHVAGLVVFGLFLTAIVALGIYAAFDRQALLALAVNPEVLRGIGVALIIVGLVWVGVVIATHLALRGRVSQAQRASGGILVGILAFAVAAPLAVASHLLLRAGQPGRYGLQEREGVQERDPPDPQRDHRTRRADSGGPVGGQAAAEHPAAGR